MKLHLDRRQVMIAGTAATAALLTRPAFASTEHIVQMLNRHPEDAKQRMVFLPDLLVVQAGDTVTFDTNDKGHNSEVIKGMFPDGAAGWKGKINEAVSVTLDIPGFYGYKCTPHYGTGMVGLLVVQGDGMMDNLDAAQGVKLRGQAKKRFQAIWEAAEAQGLLSA